VNFKYTCAIAFAFNPVSISPKGLPTFEGDRASESDLFASVLVRTSTPGAVRLASFRLASVQILPISKPMARWESCFVANSRTTRPSLRYRTRPSCTFWRIGRIQCVLQSGADPVEANAEGLRRLLDEAPPRLMLSRPDEKYTTALIRDRMARVKARATLLTTIDGLEVYQLPDD
jgi:hypothetical protein